MSKGMTLRRRSLPWWSLCRKVLTERKPHTYTHTRSETTRYLRRRGTVRTIHRIHPSQSPVFPVGKIPKSKLRGPILCPPLSFFGSWNDMT